MVEHAAMGAELDEDEEKAALDWLLGGAQPTVHDVEVSYELPDGTMAPLKFVVTKTDLKVVDRIEQANLDGQGRLDRLTADTEVVAQCCSALIDASGREVKLKSEAFLTVTRPDGSGGTETMTHASPAIALEERFRDQLGLMSVVAAEVRRLSGADPTRLGNVKRRLVKGSLG